MLGLRRLHVVKRDLRCVVKSGEGLCQIAHLSVVSKNDQFMNFGGENSPSHNGQFVSLARLKTCDVSGLLNRFGLSLNSKCSISGENLNVVNSMVELEEFVGSDVPSVKFKAFLTCLNAFKIIGVPVCFLDDSSKKEHAPLKDCSSSPSISIEESQSNDTPCVSTTQSKHIRDYFKVQVLKGHKDRVQSASLFSGNKMVTTSIDNSLRIWNLETNECEQVWDNQEYGSALATLSDGRIVTSDFISVNYCECAIKIYDQKTKLCVQTLEGHKCNVRSLLILEDNTIVSTSDDCTIRLWNSDTGECLKKIDLDIFPIGLCVVSDDIVAIRSKDKNIRIWNIKTGECVKVLEGHTDWVHALCKLPDGRLVSGSFDKTIRIWNVETGLCENILTSHTDTVTDVELLPDGRLVSSSYDNTVRIWNVNTGECEQVIRTAGYHSILLILKDGRILCTAGYNTLYIRG